MGDYKATDEQHAQDIAALSNYAHEELHLTLRPRNDGSFTAYNGARRLSVIFDYGHSFEVWNYHDDPVRGQTKAQVQYALHEFANAGKT